VAFVTSPTTGQGFCFIVGSWIWQWRKENSQ
jgi:hypothetical protein